MSVAQQGLKGCLRQTRREDIISQGNPSILIQQTNLDRGGSTFEQIQPKLDGEKRHVFTWSI